MLRRSTPSFVSLHAAAIEAVALCAAVDLPAVGTEGAPEWVHLLPAGEIRTGDGRGPYRVADPAALIATSLQAIAGGAVVDENHATDLAAPRGEAAPARGWIRDFEARTDGIWGRVEWTVQGRRLVAGRAYRGLSPVIQHTQDGRITAILRASLVNRPNLRGLTALHQENTMNPLLEKLLAALGLPAATTEDAAVAAVTALHAEQAKVSTALQAALSPIAKAAGLAETADATAILAGVEKLKGDGGGDAEKTITALQAELVTVTTTLNGLLDAGKRDKATAYVDQAIKDGRVGVKPQRDRYIAMHMADAANAEALIGALPKLGGGGTIIPDTPPAKEGEIALQAEDMRVAKLLGLDPKDYAATRKADAEAAL